MMPSASEDRLNTGKALPCRRAALQIADLLKANFFAQPIFLFKSFAQTKWPKNHHKNWKLTQKRWNSGILCIFAFKNPNLAQSLKTFARPCGRMVAAFRNSGRLPHVTCSATWARALSHADSSPKLTLCKTPGQPTSPQVCKESRLRPFLTYINPGKRLCPLGPMSPFRNRTSHLSSLYELIHVNALLVLILVHSLHYKLYCLIKCTTLHY